uniref:Pentacotripeptide-repeat region of PRORP domain-containing protein n=1 Tax=Leersia perrieri TaxID=77586 RepID=A0A0D9X9H6_9ORYZ
MCSRAAAHCAASASTSHASHCAELLSLLLRRGRLREASAVASRLAATAEPAVSDALVSFHSRLGDVSSALSHLHRLVQSGGAPSAASSASLLRAMCSASMSTEAMDVFVLWMDNPAPLPISEFALLIPGLCAEGAVDKARFLFDAMLGSGLTPPVRVYRSLAFAYCKARRSLHASEMCQLMLSKGMHLDRELSTALIRVFCQEGRLEPALDVFHRMKGDEHVHLDAYAYTTMIGGLFEHGYVDHGLELYHEMMDRGIKPDTATYNVMIKWYCKSKWVGTAMEIYKVMVRTGVKPDLRCYTILLASLGKDGKLGEAEDLFDKMLESGLFPDHIMFISIARFFPKGWVVLFVRKALKAVAKLDCSGKLLELSSFAGGCSNMSLQKDADHLLDEIVRSNVLPVNIVFNLLIIAMCSEERLDVSFYLLEKLVAYGCEPSVLTYNIVIKCLCKQNRMDNARALITLMQSRGVRPDMSTNSIMVTAYCRNGEIESALRLFDEMAKDGIEPSIAVYDSIIACMCRMGRLREAEVTLRQMIAAGLPPDEVIYASLVNGYSIMRQTRDACRIFDEMLERGLQPGSHAYGALINGLVRDNKIRKALSYLERMLEEGIAPQTVIYTMLINQFFRKGDVRLCLDLVVLMMKNHVEPDLITYGTLVTGICRNIDRRDMRPSLAKKLKEARYTLYRMLPQIIDTGKEKQKDKHISTEEKIQVAQSVIHDLTESGMMPDLHIYNGMLNGLCRANKMDDAYSLLSVMEQAGVLPNHVTYTILMNNQIRLGDSNRAIQLFNSLNNSGCFFDSITYNTFIKGLSLSGRMKEALSFFLLMQKRGFVPSKASYDKLMELLLAENAIDLVLQLFEDMFFQGYTPRYANYTSLLLVLAKDGQWSKADRIFTMMLKKGKYLDTETKKCLEELCYKDGELDLALEMEGSMALEMEGSMPLYAVTGNHAGVTVKDGFILKNPQKIHSRSRARRAHGAKQKEMPLWLWSRVTCSRTSMLLWKVSTSLRLRRQERRHSDQFDSKRAKSKASRERKIARQEERLAQGPREPPAPALPAQTAAAPKKANKGTSVCSM